MTIYRKEMLVEVVINVADGSDAISRFVGLTPEKAKEVGMRPNLTEDDFLAGLATHAIYGRSDASYCDGWADLEPDVVTMYVSDVSPDD